MHDSFFCWCGRRRFDCEKKKPSDIHFAFSLFLFEQQGSNRCGRLLANCFQLPWSIPVSFRSLSQESFKRSAGRPCRMLSRGLLFVNDVFHYTAVIHSMNVTRLSNTTLTNEEMHAPGVIMYDAKII